MSNVVSGDPVDDVARRLVDVLEGARLSEAAALRCMVRFTGLVVDVVSRAAAEAAGRTFVPTIEQPRKAAALMNVRELADHLGFTRKAVYHMVARKMIPFKRSPGGRRLMFDPEEVDRALESHKPRKPWHARPVAVTRNARAAQTGGSPGGGRAGRTRRAPG